MKDKIQVYEIPVEVADPAIKLNLGEEQKELEKSLEIWLLSKIRE